MLARLDVNLFTVGQSFDNGYSSFMGMVAMVHVSSWGRPYLSLLFA